VGIATKWKKNKQNEIDEEAILVDKEKEKKKKKIKRNVIE